MAVVPGDELGRRPRAAELFAGDPELAIGLRAEGVHDSVVEARELRVRDVAADVDVAQEAVAGQARDLLERP